MAFNIKNGDMEFRCGAIAERYGKLLPIEATDHVCNLIHEIIELENTNNQPEFFLEHKKKMIDAMVNSLISISALSHLYYISEEDIINRMVEKFNEKGENNETVSTPV